MLKFLFEREQGLLDPLNLRRAESTRRTFALELSRHRDVEMTSQGAVNSIDIDLIESRYLLSGFSDGTAAIHDVVNQTGNVKYTCKVVCKIDRHNRYKHKTSIQSVCWYPLDTGIFTTSGTDKLLKVWDTNNLIPVDEYEFSGIVYQHDLSPVATKHCLIAVGCQSSRLKLVDLKSGASSHMLKGHQSSIYCVKWSPKDEFILASGGADNRVLLWDVRSAKGAMKVLDQYNGKAPSDNTTGNTAHHGAINGLTFTSDGLHLISYGTDNCIRLWDANSGKNCLINYGNVPNDTKKLVQLSVSNGCSPDVLFIPNRSNIDMFDVYSGEKIDRLKGHYNSVNCCKFHSPTQDVYSGGNDRNILIWTPDTDSSYDDHLKTQSELHIKENSADKVRSARPTVMIDTWSSDEDD
ncbi:DNA excision repair protein ERCC-8-like [Mytilus trossulus]|uniref:DNA excision repair protein ERCC-8-like n=1 Tax=Mytilus trossulus TaxID=6551 RepID=UPI0030041E74